MNFWLEPKVKSAFEYAKILTREHAKSFYFSARLLPEETRWATYALYGFCRYADNLIDNPRDRTVGQLVLEVDALGEEIEMAYRTGESEHPIVKSFIVVAKRYNIPIHYPLDLLRGVKMDVQIRRYRNFDELYVFCYRVAGVVGLMMTHVLGSSDEIAYEYAEKLGIAMQLTNILRDIKEDMNMNRVYLPQNELKQYGISEADIREGNFSIEFKELMTFQVQRAEGYYDEANKGISLLSRKSQFSIYAASRIYRGILKLLVQNSYNPFKGRVFVSKPRKVSILIAELIRTRILNSEYNEEEYRTGEVNLANDHIV